MTTPALAELAQWLRAQRAALAQAFLAGEMSPLRYLRRHTLIVDQTLRELVRFVPLPSDAALIAVGGYGRRELYPASDIDLQILLPKPMDPTASERAEALVAALWDVGLAVGISVRTIDETLELAAQDVTVQTNLLDTRRLAGAPALFAEFVQRYHAAFDPVAFYRAKANEQEQRHAKWLSPYALEPNVKEHPGGLRDLHVLGWIAKALGFEGRWSALANAGLLLRQEARQLDARQRFVAAVRIHLHLLAQRQEDRLLFDYQTALAQRFGVSAQGDRRPAEVFIRQYYLNAKIILQLNTVLMAVFAERLCPTQEGDVEPIDPAFVRRGNRLDLVDDEVFARDPAALLRLFVRMTEHPELTGLTARAARRLWAERERIGPDYHRVPAHQAIFLAFWRAPRGIVHETRRMNQFGILSRYLPAWRRIVCQMQYDLYHEYTVDLHTLMVIRNLRRFTMEEHAHEYPEMTQLMAEFGQPDVLYLAALFHDIGKGRGGDHSLIGAEEAESFLRQHPLAPETVDLVVWLVREHLTMSRFAQKEDISDPDVIARFAAIVGNEERLIALYLLTHADIRGTSAKVWTPWKAHLLAQLFASTRASLQRQNGSGFVRRDPVLTRQEEVRTLLRFSGLRPGEENSFWQRLGRTYFLRHDPDTIAWHTRVLYWRHRLSKTIVRARLLPQNRGIAIMIFTPDAPRLLERILGALFRLGCDVWEARIHTTEDAWALDTFVIDPPEVANPRDFLNLLEYEVNRALESEAPAEPPQPTIRRLPRLVRHFGFAPQITIRPDERGRFQLLEIIALDRPGVLLTIVRTLAEMGINVVLARIHTAGERIEDTFLLNGGGIEQPRIQQRLIRRLQQALDAQ